MQLAGADPEFFARGGGGGGGGGVGGAKGRGYNNHTSGVANN